MRRAAQLYDGTAKTDPKDAWVLADYARRNLDRLRLVEATDGQLARMRALNDPPAYSTKPLLLSGKR